ncbi:MAG TPA: hypothetical protein VFZ93_01675, partial [Albitalea sp.]
MAGDRGARAASRKAPPLSLKGRALALLAQREHSAAELRRKLLRHVHARRADAADASGASDEADAAQAPEASHARDALDAPGASDPQTPPEAPATLAADAADLLTSPAAERLIACGSPPCNRYL